MFSPEGMIKIDGIQILHKEKSFVVVIKPEGFLSEETDGKNPGMVNVLAEQLGMDVYPVHRLDREASGVMVYATSKTGAAKLSALVSGNGFEKRYFVVVHGEPSESSGVMEDLLFKDSTKNKSFVVKKERKGVKKASLEYEVVGVNEYKGEKMSLVSVLLHTGRTHQIRVQFSSRQMPVAGDLRYGSNLKTEMCLFSHSISFINPFTGELQRFCAVPEYSLFRECFGSKGIPVYFGE